MELENSPYSRATEQLIGKLTHEEVCACAWMLAIYVADYRSRFGSLPHDPIGQLERDPNALAIALIDDAIDMMRECLASARSTEVLLKLRTAR
jgi:hypothetical protein